MNHRRPCRNALLMLAGWMLVVPQVPAAAGSWGRHLTGPRVAGPGHVYASRILRPPPEAAGHHITRVRWHYTLKAGEHVLAQLCAGKHCMTLPDPRGNSDALKGIDAGLPLHFRFRLPHGARQPVQILSLEVLVDYRE